MDLMLLRQFWPYILGALSIIGAVWYIQNHGKTVERNANLKSEVAEAKSQVDAERKAVVEVAKVKEIQKKEVSNARKEVNDAYSRNAVPQRVRKFYID